MHIPHTVPTICMTSHFLGQNWIAGCMPDIFIVGRIMYLYGNGHIRHNQLELKRIVLYSLLC